MKAKQFCIQITDIKHKSNPKPTLDISLISLINILREYHNSRSLTNLEVLVLEMKGKNLSIQ